MAHAVHPNYADKHEPGHRPKFGAGVVIKHNANQRYATDAITGYLFRELGERAGVPVQEFVVRSDLGCGSTIGPTLSTNTGIRTVGVGAPPALHAERSVRLWRAHAVTHFQRAVYEGVLGDGPEAHGGRRDRERVDDGQRLSRTGTDHIELMREGARAELEQRMDRRCPERSQRAGRDVQAGAIGTERWPPDPRHFLNNIRLQGRAHLSAEAGSLATTPTHPWASRFPARR